MNDITIEQFKLIGKECALQIAAEIYEDDGLLYWPKKLPMEKEDYIIEIDNEKREEILSIIYKSATETWSKVYFKYLTKSNADNKEFLWRFLLLELEEKTLLDFDLDGYENETIARDFVKSAVSSETIKLLFEQLEFDIFKKTFVLVRDLIRWSSIKALEKMNLMSELLLNFNECKEDISNAQKINN